MAHHRLSRSPARLGCVLLLGFALALVPGASRADTISTGFGANNGAAGNIFDVTNLTGLPITLPGTLRVNTSSVGSETFEVYYRPGSYVGHQSSAAGWALLGSDTVTGMGLDRPTSIDVGNSFIIPGGQTYGLYVNMASYNASSVLAYTTGASSVNDGKLRLDLGVGKGGPAFTGSTFEPRSWNGELDYQSSPPAVPEPSTYLLFGLGALGLIVWRRRRKGA